jgi:hypothetical protein
MEQKHREQRPLPLPAERERPAVALDLEGPQDSEIERHMRH